MDSYTFDHGNLVIKTRNLKEFVEILVIIGYRNIDSFDCSFNRLTNLPSKIAYPSSN